MAVVSAAAAHIQLAAVTGPCAVEVVRPSASAFLPHQYLPLFQAAHNRELGFLLDEKRRRLKNIEVGCHVH